MNGTEAETLRRRNRELSILNTIAEALNKEVNLEQALHAALTHVANLLDLRTGWIWLLDEITGESYLAAALNLPPGLSNQPARMEGSCYCLDTYHAGDMDGAANVNVVTCSRLSALVDGTDGLRYHASIPLHAHEQELGVLNVASPDWRELSEEDLRLLYTVGDLLSIAVERGRLHESSVRMGATEERNRLAREIHDTLAQGLTGISLRLETAESLLGQEGTTEQARDLVTQALELARTNLVEARRSVLDLRAATLEGNTLLDALRELAEQMDVPVELENRLANQALPQRVETGVYRIAQEGLANIQQHSQASKASLKLGESEDQLTLVLEDDGIGFDPDDVSNERFGLRGMAERARLLGGEFVVRSGDGMGTLIELRIPLEAVDD